jgi:YwiC-like protein
MLAVPYLAGLVAAGFRWPDLPLLGAWLGGYLASYFVFQAVKSRRWRRHRDQLVLWGAITVPLLAVVLAARPRLLLYAPAYAALIAVNAYFAARRRERALLNDIALVGQSCLMVFVVATVADTPPRAVVGPFLLCLAYFLGTVVYVKTMIRERASRAYRRWSIGYHAVALAALAWLGPWVAALFAWLLLRAALLPGRSLSPKRVGLLEMVNCALLLVAVALL